MCISAGMLTMLSTGLQVFGQLMQGSQQQDWAEWQAEQAQADAQAAREEGEVRADKRRRLGKTQQSEARAALAASGVEVGAGTAVVIDRKIGRDAEEDAQQEVLSGRRRGQRYDQEAEVNRIHGENAMTRSVLGAAGTLATGWRKSKSTASFGYPVGNNPDEW